MNQYCEPGRHVCGGEPHCRKPPSDKTNGPVVPQLSQDDAKRLVDAYEHACKTITDMHAAAVGDTTGPRLGVVEDVTAVRTELLNLRDENAQLRAEADQLRARVAQLEKPASTDGANVDQADKPKPSSKKADAAKPADPQQ